MYKLSFWSGCNFLLVHKRIASHFDTVTTHFTTAKVSFNVIHIFPRKDENIAGDNLYEEMLCFRTLNKLFIVLLSNVTEETMPSRIPIHYSKRKDMVLFLLLSRNEHLRLTSNHRTQKYHEICRRKSRSWLGRYIKFDGDNGISTPYLDN